MNSDVDDVIADYCGGWNICKLQGTCVDCVQVIGCSWDPSPDREGGCYNDCRYPAWCVSLPLHESKSDSNTSATTAEEMCQDAVESLQGAEDCETADTCSDCVEIRLSQGRTCHWFAGTHNNDGDNDYCYPVCDPHRSYDCIVEQGFDDSCTCTNSPCLDCLAEGCAVSQGLSCRPSCVGVSEYRPCVAADSFLPNTNLNDHDEMEFFCQMPPTNYPQVRDDIEVQLVKAMSSSYHAITEYQGKLYFAMSKWAGNAGGIWVTDGSTGGTVQLVQTSLSERDPVEYVEWNGKLYFVLEDGIWITDGGDAAISAVNIGDAHDLFAFGHLYFRRHGSFYRTDGTQDGTEELLDQRVIGSYAVFQGDLYFFVDARSDDVILYKVSPGGTPVTVKEFPSSTKDRYFIGDKSDMWIEFNDRLYFCALYDRNVYELWVTDGTEQGTELFVNLGAGDEDPCTFALFDDELYFSAYNNSQADDDDEHLQLLRIDGDNIIQNVTSIDARESFFLVFKDELFFIGADEEYGKELRKISKETKEVELVKNINENKDYRAGSSDPTGLTVVSNTTMYFYADDGIHGRELWMTDGTSSGTRIVANIHPGTEGSQSGRGVSGLAVFGDSIYFSAVYNLSLYHDWTIDDTGVGLFRATGKEVELVPEVIASDFMESNGELFFFVYGSGLWKISPKEG